MSHSDRLCRLLEKQGVRHLFTFPGGPSANFYDALSRSTIETVVATSESAAAFAALGYGAASGNPGVLCVIGGPGLSLASTALLEARCDSIPVVCLVFVRPGPEGKFFQTQHLDYRSLGSAVCKQTVETRAGEDIGAAVSEAFRTAASGEPGPVLVLVHDGFVVNETGSLRAARTENPKSPSGISTLANSVQKVLSGPGKTLIFAGRGAIPAASDLIAIAERYTTPVITTTSARGVVPEDHALSLRTDLVPVGLVNEFIGQFDHIVALGVKFSQNSLAGYRLCLPGEKLTHIDASSAVLGKNVRASRTEVADVPELLGEVALLANDDSAPTRADSIDLEAWRDRFSNAGTGDVEPILDGVMPPNAETFFAELQKLLASDSILVTDSGFHQLLARKYYRSRSANGLLVPINFQSMGFGISAAIGAKLASQDRQVVAIIGDGGLRMSGLELLTAVSRKLAITIVVFDDQYYSEVRNKQLMQNGKSFGMDVPIMKYVEFAASIGIDYVDGSTDPIAAIGKCLKSPGVRMINVCLHDSPKTKIMMQKTKVKSVGKRLIGRLTGAI